ncbi:sterol desaturase family protein [Marinicauda algicola]|uniref:Sterol desaturase family protein n=1 Tax=Marinicauda algicola TaxID=2029849 RepID=A0A4S2GXA5_9PROT|nr:sterol desaturase family protein [Marinicauda algicola]TGY87663.1 sterol desaturase family protein [Marinicauda algicola]
MPEILTSDPQYAVLPVVIAIMFAEIVFSRFSGRVRYEAKDTMANMLLGFGSTIVGALAAGGIFAVGIWIWDNFALFEIGWSVWAFIAAFVLTDFAFYWDHRLGHRVRWMWASHSVHHSSQHFNLTTAFRQTWTAPVALTWLVYLPLFAIGFHPLMIAFVKGLNLIYQFWIHTEAIGKLPRPVEWLMNTPSNHRVHHARNPRYIDANYAGVFMLWDRIFGTAVDEDEAEPCRYGLVTNIATFNPVHIALAEWIALGRDLVTARSWRDRANHVFAPPGWRPDGKSLTSRILRQRWEAHAKSASKGPEAEAAE